MTDQVYSMGWNKRKESGHDENELVPTLVRILEGLKIVQVVVGFEMTIFLTSEGDVLEIGEFNKNGEPFLKHKFSEPIVKIEAGFSSFYAISSLGNVFSWRSNDWNQLGFPTGEEYVLAPQMISFFSEKGLKVEEVVGSHYNSYFLCEGGELFGAGEAERGKLGNPELKTNPDTPILISKDVERVFLCSAANHVFFTKFDESVWSFGWNGYNQRGFEGNEPNVWGMRLHNDLTSNDKPQYWNHPKKFISLSL